ncbi:DNA-binding IclR family transcriptional regulator [Arthrobacter sp. PvP102]|uniref:IclR family transcriptional regulator n=1 Tax=unclassified Arthrobacter TaxID=235627 RepID=UPI001AE380B8|nr:MULTISPECIES: IclR family transcriptional regulator [unclassified Arthrobacter]MBP1232833.1 DNA-binding IclR family transcriptional regulator [Arthrobacter sp. PvP103]MBP1237968.1 DNA-binding IclR family transcriptional regulator [Arthrobacter sp. PvP102]
MANSASGESVIQRVVKILDAFSRGNPRLTLAELVRITGMSSSTAHRLAGGLVDSGLLNRGADGDYGVGVKMWELASRSNPLEEFRRRGLPFLEGVHAAVRENVSLSVPDVESCSVLYLERLDRHGTVLNLADVAGRLDIHNTSSGLAMMAHMPRHVQERFLAGPLQKTTPATETDPVKIRAHLALIRERGYVRLAGVLVPENTAYSVPVFGEGNSVIGAIAVVVPTADEKPQVILPVLVAAGRGLSRTMGAERRPYGTRPWLETGRQSADARDANI